MGKYCRMYAAIIRFRFLSLGSAMRVHQFGILIGGFKANSFVEDQKVIRRLIAL